MPDRHAQTPISIRPPRDDREWLEAYAAQTGRPVRRIIVDAITRERAVMTGTTPARLAEADRDIIAEARRLGPALRASGSDRDRLAGWLLKELADTAERLDGRAAAQVTEARHG